MKEPHISFHHADLKIEWAKTLLFNLNREIESFLEKKPYSFTVVPSADGIGNTLKVSQTERLPYTIPCIVGDICGNARASLDFCWTGLLRAAGKTVDGDTLPFANNAKGLTSTCAKRFEGEALEKVKKLVVSGICSHYDFGAGGSRQLAALNDLRNWQKHNMLVPTLHATKLPENMTVRDNRGNSVTIGTGTIYGSMNLIGLGGSEMTLSHEGEPSVEITVKAKYLSDREPLMPLMRDFIEAAAQGVQAFKEAWPA